MKRFMNAIFPHTQLVLGSRYAKPNLVKVIRFDEDLVGGLTPGKATSVRRKIDGNEDAMGVIRRGPAEYLLLLADSHFGSMAGDFAVTHFFQHFREAEGATPQKLFTAHLTLDAAIRREKTRLGHIHPGCATTFISVSVKKHMVHYCVTGDSQIFLKRGERIIPLCDPHDHLFLGDPFLHLFQIRRTLLERYQLEAMADNQSLIHAAFELSKIHQQVTNGKVDPPRLNAVLDRLSNWMGQPFPISEEDIATPWNQLHIIVSNTLPAWGTVRLKKGDGLFLATDGLEEEVSGCSLEEVGQIVTSEEESLETRAERLLKRCMGRHGGQDNLMFLLFNY